MRDVDKSKPSPTPDDIVLRQGDGSYPIRETEIGMVGHRHEVNLDDSSVEAEVLALSILAHQARTVIEAQGGQYNGIVERIVQRTDQDWMGATVAISIVYALAHKE